MNNRVVMASLLLGLMFVPSGRQTTAQVPESITTPAEVDSILGPLHFEQGVPDEPTTQKLMDHLDRTYAYRAFMDNLRGVSIAAANG